MNRFFTCIAALLSAISMNAQKAEYFTPYKSTALRLPSVPIVVNDPYLSIWSPYDKLTDGPTRHWTHAQKAINGLLRVDGTTYRFMGVERPYILKSILPMANEKAWTAKTSRSFPGNGWANSDFDDSSWGTETGAFGTPNEYPNVNTSWTDTNSDVYTRRTVSLTADDLKEDLYAVYSHDDVFELYINGYQIVSTGETWLQNETLQLTDEMKKHLHEGENVIAAHCHNTTGGALLDYGLFKNTKKSSVQAVTATQKSVDVLATSTYYTFECGPVDLKVVFTAPMLIDDLDLLSTPINYVSYNVTATDGKKHDVQFLLSTTPELAVNQSTQRTVSRYKSNSDFDYMYTGTTTQPILKKSGDAICIDWGYLYMPAINGSISLSSFDDLETTFANDGKLPNTKSLAYSTSDSDMPCLSYIHDFGSVESGSSFAMIGYDELYDIQYMGKNYKGYWARNGKTLLKAFAELRDNYDDIMTRCRALDKRIYDDGLASGNTNYAELLSGSYRHVIAAHKLFEDNSGNLLFFSKENNSNGCVNTVDLTYPSAPLFLKYNPELMKGMMTSIFEYSRTGRWTKPFAAHDLGTYPLANGQVYGGDMPLEESGNLLTLTATISMLEGNTNYADKYWDILKIWTDYLVENGQDPANQLCTDDFAGHWAHNANLSVKAIMGIAGFAELARIKGDQATADKYMAKAREMARIWVSTAREGDHYRLAFDRNNTWSQKYNLVWDKLWNIHIFPGNVIEREIEYYQTKFNRYGLPLDSRSDYTKSDWIMWTASMAEDKETFLNFADYVYKYTNETSSRVPASDWYYTTGGNMVGFKARSVIGGYWMRVLMDDMYKKQPLKEWAPIEGGLSTRWASEVTPDNALPEYPRPMMERTEWQNLNGLWDYGFTASNAATAPKLFDGKILVPFPLESSLSGVKINMPDNNVMWYKRTFTLPESWKDKNIIINFGASDYTTTVYVNGRSVATHTGGYASFSADITKNVVFDGENTISVKVDDKTNADSYALGKQRKSGTGNGSIWYTSVSGIWQTVWLEPVNAKHITAVNSTSDIDNNTLTITPAVENAANGDMVKVTVSYEGAAVAEKSVAAGSAATFEISDPHLWSPDSPSLYDVEVSLMSGSDVADNVKSYAAMRKISTGKDKDGIMRVMLNNQPLFQLGLLDQGYWPDGLYTAPTDDALRYDIEVTKSLGYNLIRKHMKVEPARWYYYCDKLGLLVWQDMPAIGKATETWTTNDWYSGKAGSLSAAARLNFKNEWSDIIKQHISNPSIVVWTPFNEAWGQYQTASVVAMTQELDPTRIVNPASGGNHYQCGDILDIHDYSNPPSFIFYDATRPTVIGEFGGLQYNVEGHRWDDSYTNSAYDNADDYTNAYTGIISSVSSLAKPVDGKAFSAAVFTQTTDVETEMNGIMTYDRAMIKGDADKMTAANKALCGILQNTTGINGTHADGSMAVEVGRFNTNGQRVGKTATGVVIIKYSDGSARKTVIK